VEVFEWPNTILKTSELDFAKGGYVPTNLSTKEDLLKKLDGDYDAEKKALEWANHQSQRAITIDHSADVYHLQGLA